MPAEAGRPGRLAEAFHRPSVDGRKASDDGNVRLFGRLSRRFSDVRQLPDVGQAALQPADSQWVCLWIRRGLVRSARANRTSHEATGSDAGSCDPPRKSCQTQIDVVRHQEMRSNAIRRGCRRRLPRFSRRMNRRHTRRRRRRTNRPPRGRPAPRRP